MKMILVVVVVLGGMNVVMVVWVKDDLVVGVKFYVQYCIVCYGVECIGVLLMFLVFIDVGKWLQFVQVKDKIRKGGGLMLFFLQLLQQEIDDIVSYLVKQWVGVIVCVFRCCGS